MFVKRFKELLASQGGSFKPLLVSLAVEPHFVKRRFANIELRKLAKFGCPVSEPEKEINKIENMKILRRQLKIPEIAVCGTCQLKQICPMKKVIFSPEEKPVTPWLIPEVLQHFVERKQNLKETSGEQKQKEAFKTAREKSVQMCLTKLMDNLEGLVRHPQSLTEVVENQKIINQIYSQLKKMQILKAQSSGFKKTKLDRGIQEDQAPEKPDLEQTISTQGQQRSSRRRRGSQRQEVQEGQPEPQLQPEVEQPPRRNLKFQDRSPKMGQRSQANPAFDSYSSPKRNNFKDPRSEERFGRTDRSDRGENQTEERGEQRGYKSGQNYKKKSFSPKNQNFKRDDRRDDRRSDRQYDRKDNKPFERKDNRQFERRDDRQFERRDDRQFERRDDRRFEKRDDRQGERFQRKDFSANNRQDFGDKRRR